MVLGRTVAALVMAVAGAGMLGRGVRADWLGYAGDDQHTAVSAVESQPLNVKLWQTQMDTDPTHSGSFLYIHYGSPMITNANTVIVPVKDTNNDRFEIRGLDGVTGAVKWTQPTDYTLPGNGGNWPSYSWVPSYGPGMSANGSMYYAGAGGTVYTRSGLDGNATVTATQMSFVGMDNYAANAAFFNANVAINTPITADAAGNIYFGYSSTGAVLPGLNQSIGSGIARISASGEGTFFRAQDLLVNGTSSGMNQAAMNAAPAISRDGSMVYALVSAGNNQAGRLVALNSTTLAPVHSVALLDPNGNPNATVLNDSTASPMIGPDGDVYMGVFGNSYRGYLEHFSADLSVTKTPGGFGWDVTPSVVPAAMVPSYHGDSAYLLMVKYNSYFDGQNKIAILDPNDTQIDAHSGNVIDMKEIMSILGPTAEGSGVREWCINSAVVDPATNSVLVNNEDGKVYRWDLTTNTLTQVMTLTGGLGEAYTPTLVGPNGTVYAINDGVLFAVGVPTVAAGWTGANGSWSDGAKWSAVVGAGGPQNAIGAGPVTQWFDTTIGAGNVTLDVDALVHSLTVASGGSITGTHNLTVSNATIAGEYHVTGVTHVSGTMLLMAGGAGHTAGRIEGTGTVIVDTGATLVSGLVTVRNLAVYGHQTVQAAAGFNKVVSLVIGGSVDHWTGTLDLTDRPLVVEAEGAAKKAALLATLQNQVLSGSQNNWTGTGITSSTAGADAGHYGLGIFDNAVLGLSDFGGGVGNVDRNSILITLALLGDGNLDGHVNGDDLAVIGSHWGLHGATNWAQGDLNDDGVVDSLDVTMAVDHWDVGAEFLPVVNYTAGFSYTLTAVPEAGTLGILGMGLVLVRRRRGRR